MSYVTRLIPATSLVIRDEIFRRTSEGNANLEIKSCFRKSTPASFGRMH